MRFVEERKLGDDYSPDNFHCLLAIREAPLRIFFPPGILGSSLKEKGQETDVEAMSFYRDIRLEALAGDIGSPGENIKHDIPRLINPRIKENPAGLHVTSHKCKDARAQMPRLDLRGKLIVIGLDLRHKGSDLL
ncbi:MAG: hypothetical protein A2184_03595 [Candidatus Moranbacteria bacterium RIFOXYA1_FULL_44_7]|nr:MAG: hypothetical protein A2184_03595 [Candidatus Moranbacteria bacterium RIFOXYA1_FULL_44_7]